MNPFPIRARAALAALLFLAAPAFAENFLWEVSSLTNTVYLFGTVHAGKGGWFPLPRTVEETLDACPVLVVEADVTDRKAMAGSADAMTYKPPDSLRAHVAPEDYARMRKLLPRYPVPEAELAQMKPFMASSLLVFAEWARLGYYPRFSVDAYLIQLARAKGKRVEELEGVQAQLRLMESLTDRENRDAFSGTIAALESGLADAQIEGIVKAWQVGDTDLLLDTARRYNEQVKGAAEFEDKFIWSRHPAMLKKIEDDLDRAKERRFIAIGALHLAGPKGLVELLRKDGYTVRRVFVAPQGEKTQ